jgi:hypothetical protein
MTERISRVHPWCPRLVLGLAVGSLGAGCSSPQEPVTGPTSNVAETQAAALPPGAIQVGEELYQVPIGKYEDGCTMYRLYSPSMLVAQVISYRDFDGGFTTDRREADCTTDGRD